MTRRRLKARRDRRGRPRKHVKRPTTTAGRAAPDDPGTPELRAHRARRTGSLDLPDDLLGVLYGRGVLDLTEYTTARDFSALVRLMRLGLGLTEASPAGAWRNILSAAHSGGQAAVAVGYPGAERARRALLRFRRELGRDTWHVVADATDNIWPSDRLAEFVGELHTGLGYLGTRLPLR